MSVWQEQTAGTEHAALLRDWITIWQSEYAALAVDPELQEAWARALHQWAANQSKALFRPEDLVDRAPEYARAAPSPGTSPFVAAPDGEPHSF